tara:strand:+ start:2451 stop:3095 length:645 start_codon:yes stop_codon:yes gene_type:complete
MKNVITLMLGLFLTTSAYADITGNIGYQNDYVFRGVNQTQSGGSLSTQVIVDSNGFYGGVSASQVDFGDEVDSDWLGMLNAGFAFAFNQNVAIDIGVLSHHFDNDVFEQMDEVYGGVSVGSFSGYVYHNVDNQDNFAELLYDFYFGDGTLQLVYGYHDENVDYFQVRGNYSFNDFTIFTTIGYSDQNTVADFLVGDLGQSDFLENISVGFRYNF